MGAKKEALILKALEERQRFAGRRLMADATTTPRRSWRSCANVRRTPTFRPSAACAGAARPVATSTSSPPARPAVMDAFTRYRLVERVLARGETKSSVLLWGGFQADLRLVPRESRGARAAVLHRIEGAQHRAARPRDRARLQAERIRPVPRRRRRRGSPARPRRASTQALGLDVDSAGAAREPRRDRRRRSAGRSRARPAADLRGDLHMHTTATDGRTTSRRWRAPHARPGSNTSAITDHSQALAMANGLDEPRALEHAGRIRAIGTRLDGITLLAGIECDIRPDGSMDLADDCLAAARLRGCVGALGVQPGRGADDRPTAARASPARGSTFWATRLDA